MKTVTITKNEAGQRMDKMLAKYLNLAPKSFIYKMIRKKNITLNGKRCDGSEKLAEGDEISLFLSDETIGKFSQVKIQKVQPARLTVVYEDEDVLMVSKPSGMLSQKASPSDESLVEHITDYLLSSGQLAETDLRSFRPGICNRLDRNTSGLIVAGKSLKGLQAMSEAFKNRSLKKYYLCIVRGKITEGSRISGYLRKDERTNKVTVETAEKDGCLPIETEYLPLDTNGDSTLLLVDLITGRSHQIRAHLASIGHPIAGDTKYGDPKLNQVWRGKYRVSSQLLHAWKLVFPQKEAPFSRLSGKSFEAPLPKEFLKVMDGEGLSLSKEK